MYARSYNSWKVQRSFTRRAALDPTAAPLVTAETLRNHLGLYTDTSHDALLEDYLLAAMERVGDEIGEQLQGLEITDVYPRAGTLELSSRAVTTGTTITVRGRLSESPTTLTPITEGWFLDPSARPPLIVFESNPSLTDKYMNPLEVTYTPSGITEQTKDTFQIQEALKYIVSVHFENRGTGILPERWERGLYSLLGSARRIAI